MLIDFILACAHHVAIFLLAGALAAEFVLLRGELGQAAVLKLARADMVYGASAGAVILIGIGRVVFGLKGWEFYVYNWAFWAKMAAFALVGILSAHPTARIANWRRQAASKPGSVPPSEELARVRRMVLVQCCAFCLIPIFAAAMARGIGY
jgi:putative membrane protein